MACLKIALDYALTCGSLRNLKIDTEAAENGWPDNIQAEKTAMCWYWARGRRCIVSRCPGNQQSGT